MRDSFSSVWQVGAAALGAAVFVGLILYIGRMHSHYWRIVARTYAGLARTPRIVRRFPETIVITERRASGSLRQSRAGWRTYAGTRMEVHEDGLALSLVLPFNFMCPPLFLPFADMDIVETSWAMWTEPTAIRLRRDKEADIIIARDTARWLRSCAPVPG